MPKRPCSRSWRATTAPPWLIVISRAPIRARDPQPGQRDRDRVAVLADRDQRLRVDARRRGLGRVERLGGQRAQQRPLAAPTPRRPSRRARRSAARRSASQPASSSALSSPSVGDRRDRDEVVAAEAADLALDAALLVRALEARRGELRLEQVVRAQRDEAVGLDAPAALEHLLDRRAQVVVADQREHAAEPLERLDVQLQERLLGLDQRRLTERRARERGAHQEQVHRRRARRASSTSRLAPVDLGLARPARAPAARTPRRPASPSRACARARSRAPSSRRPRRRARRPAAARSASPCGAACAAPPDRPQATRRSAPDTAPSFGAGLLDGDRLRRRQRRRPTPAAPPDDAPHGAPPAPGSTTPPGRDRA